MSPTGPSALKPAERLLARWYSRRPAPWLLRPLAALYGGLQQLRRRGYRRGWLASVRLEVPVVVVGNISLGGTGKTPLVIALVEYLRSQGRHPGVVSRGYGGRERGPHLLGERADPLRFGDEPCLIRRRTGVPVAVGRDRPAAARLLLESGVDVVIADDGLQHYRLQRDVEICVIDGARRFGNGWVLPAGPLREPMRRLDEVHFRVSNGGLPQPGEVLMRLLGDQARRVDDPSQQRPLSTFARRRVHAVAAIGHPQRFFDSLRAQHIDVIEHAFPDHHVFAAHELAFDDGLPVLMTEKDAVKCERLDGGRCWFVPVRAVLAEAFLASVLSAVLDAQSRLARAPDAADGPRRDGPADPRGSR